jgi:hypothetical protein
MPQVVALDKFDKIKKIAEVVQGDNIIFIVRRTEPVDDEEAFVKLHAKYKLKCQTTRVSARSQGELPLNKFVDFLKEYDEQFELGETVIELESVVINPLLM